MLLELGGYDVEEFLLGVLPLCNKLNFPVLSHDNVALR